MGRLPSDLKWGQFGPTSGYVIRLEPAQKRDHAGWLAARCGAEKDGGFGDPVWIHRSVARADHNSARWSSEFQPELPSWKVSIPTYNLYAASSILRRMCGSPENR